MRQTDAIARKLKRLRETGRPMRVLDLFAGCGGLSLGFQAAGFEIAAAVELDKLAASSHAMNFVKEGEDFAHHATSKDITQLEPEQLPLPSGVKRPENAFDVIIGGPPCQAYARVGRAKLREIAEHPEAFRIDPRANLYLRYLHYVDRLKPLALLMENVPDIMNFGGHNVVQEMAETLDAMGYEARYSLINSAHHGVPQMRDRVFMIAYRKELNLHVQFPRATHQCVLPSGYAGTRAVALKHIDPWGGSNYVEPDLGNPELPGAVSAAEAIRDLPPITSHRQGLLRRGARHFDELLPYALERAGNLSSYARELRGWAGFAAGEGVFDHVLRCLPRDTSIFEAMGEGDEYPAAHRVAFRLFEAEAARRQLARDSTSWLELQRTMVPPYDPSKFPNRWWKLRADRPVRTLTAHIGKDTYSHIHYDSAQARVITVREAARLQSFPDGFVFSGAMNAAFRQIGNAVPPIIAREIAKSMQASLRCALRRTVPTAIAAE